MLGLLAALLLEVSMRTPSAADEAVLAASARRTLVRVQVKDSGGTWRDLSSYPGENFVLGASWKEDVDTNGLTADITLRRATNLISLAPLMAASPLNVGWTPGGTYSPLLGLGRGVRIEVGLAGDGMAPASWLLVFDGYIDAVEPQDDVIKVEARGLEAALMDTFIERERVYAYAQGAAAVKGLYVFDLGRAYALNELVVPGQAKQNGHYYKVTTAGTSSASSEPTWPTGSGSTVTSGTVTFTEVGAVSPTTGTPVETVMQQMLDDHLGGVTLYVPTSPSWSIKWFLQERKSLWEALRALAEQIGWDLRYQWDNGTSAWRLTLIKPDRTKSSPDRTFTASQVLEMGAARQTREDVRNVVRVVYSDSGDLDAQGAPKRKSVEVTDSASVTAYGRRWMELAEGSSSNIDTSTEATTLANGILADLATPVLTVEPELQLFPFVQLGDLYALSGDGIRWDGTQTLAVVGYEHSVDESKASTKVQVRGKPVAGVGKWLAQANTDRHLMQMLNAGSVQLAVADLVGGTGFTVAEPAVGKHAKAPGYELHVSASSGFTPSSATLRAAGDIKAAVIPDLTPGKTYYARLVPFARNASRIVKAEPSAETSFKPGWLQGRHVFPYLDFRRYPLNGAFESPGTNGVAPDAWDVSTGTNGVDFEVNNNNPIAGASGTMSLELKGTAVGTVLLSGWVPVIETQEYELRYFLNRLATPAAGHNLYVSVVWYDYQQTVISSTVDTVDLSTTGSGGRAIRVTPASTAAWARVSIGKDPYADIHIAVDDVELAGPFDPWHAFSYSNNWASYGSGYVGAGYTKDPNGRVHLRGLIKRASGVAGAGETMFTLPAGYRPSASMRFQSETNSGNNVTIVYSSGVGQWNGGGYSYLVLDGISFDTR